MATRGANPTTRQRNLRRRLRELRTQDGRTAAAVALALGWSESRLARLETTSVRPKIAAVQQLLDEYGIEASERDRILGLVEDARARGWWDDYQDIVKDRALIYVGLEAEASHIRTYEAQLIPSLLQTPEYAAAALERRLPWPDEQTLARQVELRKRRQQVLSGPRPATMWAIVDEAALHRVIGDPKVMRDQLAHLVELGRHDHIHIQVLPFAAGAHAGTSTFIALDFPDSVDPEVVYLESIGSSTFVEDLPRVETFRLAFESMVRQAWSVRASRTFIEKLLSELG